MIVYQERVAVCRLQVWPASAGTVDDAQGAAIVDTVRHDLMEKTPVMLEATDMACEGTGRSGAVGALVRGIHGVHDRAPYSFVPYTNRLALRVFHKQPLTRNVNKVP